MVKVNYTASLSKSQNRSGYTVIFRHPTRMDPTGKSGVRVRRGLGTRDRAEAEKLRDELNELLKNAQFHSQASRADAERRFDPRVVDIFYDKLVPEPLDYAALRETVIPLPESSPDGYRRVLMLGTTGAGKTTLVRQIIGTDPATERFPSTSTAKTTIHDTEIVLDQGTWRAVVTFASYDEVRESLNECISAAVLEASKGADDAKVLRRLLIHVDQRFRFNYILGNGPALKLEDEDADDDDEPIDDPVLIAGTVFGEIDLEATNTLLAQVVEKLRTIAARLGDRVRQALNPRNEQDERVAGELFEEELDNLLRDEEDFHDIGDELIDEFQLRFDLLPPGTISKTKQGWPLMWHQEWPVDDRAGFLKAIAQFSSNHSPLFGRLLTPIVNGVRVAGPFGPEWQANSIPKLVLLDGEGLGHSPKSSSSISTSMSQRIGIADAVVLVDSATQPMQAAPLAAIREVVSSGYSNKLIFAFTHFDEVRGDNLPNAKSKELHVLASAENVIASLRESIGPVGERALRNRIETVRFFLGGLHEPLSPEKKAGQRTIEQLSRLLGAIDSVLERPQPHEARPEYDRMNLGFAIRDAAESFHEEWLSRLGLKQGPGSTKEHWTRVKALTRRLSTGRDEYDSLRPVADLRKELVERIYVFIQNPLRWDGPDTTDDQRLAIYNALAENIGRRLMELSRRRVLTERIGEWQSAFDLRGTGSTFVRARMIDQDIYLSAAPVPDVTPSPDRNQFLRDVVAEVEGAAKDIGALLS